MLGLLEDEGYWEAFGGLCAILVEPLPGAMVGVGQPAYAGVYIDDYDQWYDYPGADPWPCYYPDTGALNFLWSAGSGTFADPTSNFTLWYAPTTPGTYTLSYRVTDDPTNAAFHAPAAQDDPAEGTASITVVKVDLVIDSLDEEHEVTPGLFLGLNVDDDNGNNIPDRTEAISDARAGADNDLKAITSMTVTPSAAADQGTLSLTFDASRLALHKKRNGTWTTYTTSDPPIEIEADATYYLEAKAAGTAGVTLSFSSDYLGDPDPTATDSVSVKIPAASVKVRRKGTTGAYATGATIAAGGKEPDVHHAEIEVSTSPAAPSGFALTFGIDKKAGQGNGQSDTSGEGEVTIGSSTNADGKILGTYKSSNKVENVTIECQDCTGSALTGFGSATVAQKWDERGVEEGWDYPEYCWYEVPATISLTIVLETDTTLPLQGHSMEFYPTTIVGWKWDEEDWIYKPWVAYDSDLYTRQEIEDLHPEAEEIEGSASLATFASFDPEQDVTDEDGLAQSDLTVHEDSEGNWLVTEVYFWASDQDVWED